MPTQLTNTGVVFPDSTTQTSAAKSPLGVSAQNWQVLTGSRSLGVNYTNSSGRPIHVHVMTNLAGNAVVNAIVGGQTFLCQSYSITNSCQFAQYIVVPDGAVYQVYKASGTTVTLSNWQELR